MREIKFRYWNKTNNIMVFEPSIRSDYQFSLNEYLGDDRGWVWMQYTGLKDKNGKEIYEGDILKDSWSENNLGVVEFKDGQIHYNLSYIEDEAQQAEFSEIIGNIYENPDLLSTSQE